MPRRTGGAREVTDAKRAMRVRLLLLGRVAMQPHLAAIVCRSTAHAHRELARLRKRVSQAWPPEYNEKEVDVAWAVAWPHIFEATFVVKPDEVIP
jgi:hypothetical protein